MNHSMINAASGMRAMQLRIDTIAHNMANSDTVGYKSSDTTFASLLTSKLNNQPYDQYEQGRLTPYGIRPGFGAKEAIQQVDYTQGTVKQTDQPTDLYLEGEAYFRVQSADANRAGEALFTRDGSFKFIPTAGNQLQLVTANGDYVMDSNPRTPRPIRIPANATNFRVDSTGQITYRTPAGVQQTHSQRIGVYTVQNPNILDNVGENYFRLPLGPGQALNTFAQVSNNVVQMPQGLAVHQGGLEMSNVDLRKEMTSLMESQRALQFNSRALSYGDQMMDVTNRIFRG
jgi:flagellar basal-body rod protein FlgG